MASRHPDEPFAPHIDVNDSEYQTVSAVSTPHFYRVLLSSPSGAASLDAHPHAPTAADAAVIKGSGSVSPLRMSSMSNGSQASAQRRLVFGTENSENMSRKMNAKSAPFVPQQRSTGSSALKGDREPRAHTCSFCYDLLPPAKTEHAQRHSAATDDKRPDVDAACKSTDGTRCADCQNMLHSHMSPKQASQLARFEQMRPSARLHDLQTVGLHARPGADIDGFAIGGTLDSSRARGAATEFADSPFLIRLRQFHVAHSNERAAAVLNEDQVHASGAGKSASISSAIASVQSTSCANQSCQWTGFSAAAAAAADHQSECPFVLVACPYSVYGCLFRVSRGNLDAHMVSDAISHLALADACVRNLSGILVAMNKNRRKPIGLHPLAVPDLTDSELIAIISRILLEHGQATIGKLGSLLQSYTDNHNLSQFIKERHGGLKRFCEKANHVFLIGADHQYNPTVSLHLLQ